MKDGPAASPVGTEKRSDRVRSIEKKDAAQIPRSEGADRMKKRQEVFEGVRSVCGKNQRSS